MKDTPSSDGTAGVVGVVLAGGGSRRFAGGAKWAADLGGMRLIDRVIARAKPQVSALAVNLGPGVDGDFAAPILRDVYADCGPLAGLHVGLRWARAAHPEAAYLASFACDTPFLPEDLTVRLALAAREAEALVALPKAGGRTHPALGLWSVTLCERIEADLQAGARRLTDWALAQAPVLAAFEDADAFFNINTTEDLAEAQARLAAAASS